MGDKTITIHPTADVSAEAAIGDGSRIWHQAQIRERARIGENCIIGKGSYIDFDVQLGDNVKVQNYVSVYHGASVEDGVFLGPYVCLTNDKLPRAITPNGQLKRDEDWEVGQILIKYGAAIGARSVILPDITVGCFALVGAGSVVTKNVPDHGIVVGNPARLVGYACKCGRRLQKQASRRWYCATCLEFYDLPDL
jgi:UDP-2-acetamido-3-amino-2,3-dideoxy-glucuronate N-acetyltransferase